MVWQPFLSVITYFKPDQMIFCGVFNPASGEKFFVVFVYAMNFLITRRTLWTDIIHLANTSLLSQSPWVLLEDFNQILTSEEHFSIAPFNMSLQGII